MFDYVSSQKAFHGLNWLTPGTTRLVIVHVRVQRGRATLPGFKEKLQLVYQRHKAMYAGSKTYLKHVSAMLK